MSLRALVLNCTLKPSPQESNTGALAEVVVRALRAGGAETDMLRVADYDVRPGVTSDEGDGDQWPALHERILAAQVLVIATPTWLGRPSSVTRRI